MTTHRTSSGSADRNLVMFAALSVLSACANDPYVNIGDRPTAYQNPISPSGVAATSSAGHAGSKLATTTQTSTAGAMSVPSGVGPAPSTIKPYSLDLTGANNPAGLAQPELTKLIAGGPPGKLRWLYPYDGTVFPGGMLAPNLMWEGSATAQAIYLRIRAAAFDYKIVIKPEASQGANVATFLSAGGALQPQHRIAQDVWNEACKHTLGKADVFTIELSTLENGNVAGPIVSHFTIAPGAVKGAIFYTTYGSTAALGQPIVTSGVGDLMRIHPGERAEKALAAPATSFTAPNTCHGCHSVAANGSRLVMQAIVSNTGAPMMNLGWTYQIDVTGAVIDPKAVAKNAAYVALYPDGSKYLAPSQVIQTATPIYALADRWLSQEQAANATLYDTASGQVVPDTGIPATALMPAFSPDGSRLVFNDYASNAAHGLVMMDYDLQRHKATRYRTLLQNPAASSLANPYGTRPGWPAFLPDNKAVVFVQSESADFSSGFLTANYDVITAKGGQVPGMPKADASDLHLVDASTSKLILLGKAMGFNTAADAANGVTYLPFGEDDTHHNYFPTVSPVAAGGYFWIFFDSRRHYGNLGKQRQLWGAAIDIQPNGGSYTLDPSHPAFYLEGQDLGPDNHRAFAALATCRPDKAACATGIDCCTGFCSDVCIPKRDSCAQRDERCATAGDCCGSSDYCINGFCAFVDLQ